MSNIVQRLRRGLPWATGLLLVEAADELEASQARVAEAEELLTAVATLRLMPAVDGAIWRGEFAAWLRSGLQEENG